MKIQFPLVVLLVMSVISIASCDTLTKYKMQREGHAFSVQFLEDVGKSWQWDAISERLDSRVEKESFSSVLAIFDEVFGPVKSVERAVLTKNIVRVGKVVDFSGEFKIPATFEKRKANALLSVYKFKSKWYLMNFELRSDALVSYKKEERKAALKVAKELVQELCTEWDADKFETRVSSIMNSVQSFEERNSKEFFEKCRERYGSFEKFEGERVGKFAKRQGLDAFESLFKIKCEKETILVNIEIEEVDGKWLINTFTIRKGR